MTQLENKIAQELTFEEVKRCADSYIPDAKKLGKDGDGWSYGGDFPEGRKDVCVAKSLYWDSSNNEYHTLVLIWKDGNGAIQHCEIDCSSNGGVVYAESIKALGNEITVSYVKDGNYPCRAPRQDKIKTIKI